MLGRFTKEFRRPNSNNIRYNESHPEAQGLRNGACYVPTAGGGMIDLVSKTRGVNVGNGGTTKPHPTVNGMVDAYFDGNGDRVTFASSVATLVGAGAFTLVWECTPETLIDSFGIVCVIARNAFDQPYRLFYIPGDASYGDVCMAIPFNDGARFAFPSGVLATGQRHVGVYTFNGGTFTTVANHQMWINGKSCTASSSGAGGTITDENSIGSNSAASGDFKGAVGQVRVMPGVIWTADQAAKVALDPLGLFKAPRFFFVEGTAGGTTAVSKDNDLRWDVLSSATKDADLRWNVLSAAVKDADFRWNLVTALQKDSDLRWNLISSALKDVNLRWDMSGSVTKDGDMRWNILTALLKDADFRWNVVTALQKDSTLQWNLIAAVAKNSDLRWDILSSLTAINKDIDLRWNLVASIFNSLTAQWNLLTSVQKDESLIWQVAVAVAKDYSLRWDITGALASAQKDITMQWSLIAATSKDVTLQWTVQSDIVAGITTRYIYVLPEEGRVFVLRPENLH